MNVLEL